MFKVSTIYAACGKQQPSNSTRAGRGGGKAQSGTLSGDDGTSNFSTINSSSAGTVTVEQNGWQAGTSTCGLSSASGFSLEPRNWAQQASSITDGLVDAAKYKSLAVYAEVKLAEALEQARAAYPTGLTTAAAADCDDQQQPPNPLATAVCCQLLGELADLCGPFQPTLLKLREALLPSIYSCRAGPNISGVGPLQLDVMPWFALAGKLRRENEQLLEQQAVFSRELAQHQAQMVVVEQQLQGFQVALESGTATATALHATNANLVAERNAAVAEAAAAAEDSKRLTAEVNRLMAELDQATDQLESIKDAYGSDQDRWKTQLDIYKQQLHVEQQERATVAALAGAEQQELEQKLWDTEQKLEEVEKKLQQFAQDTHTTHQQKQQQEQEPLTPRPRDWGPAQELADSCQSTSETVRQLLQQHQATATSLQRQLQLLSALTAPDPAPKSWQLSMRADSSTYFLTELGANPEPQASASSSQNPDKPRLYAEGLGLGPGVPRFLRWDEPVGLHEVSVQELEQQVCKLWQAKASYEAFHGPCSLQTFLHEHFWAQAQSAAADNTSNAGPSAPGVPSSAARHAPGSSNSGSGGSNADQPGATAASSSADATMSGVDVPQPLPASASAGSQMPHMQHRLQKQTTCALQAEPTAAAASAAAGYQLYHACCTHHHESVTVELMLLILTGQLPELMLKQQQQQLSSMLALLEELHRKAGAIAAATTAGCQGSEAATEAAGRPVGVPWTDVSTALRMLFPLKPKSQLDELSSCLELACRFATASINEDMISTSGSGCSPDSSNGTSAHATALATVVQGFKQQLHARFGNSSHAATAPDDDAASSHSDGSGSQTGAAAGATAPEMPSGAEAAVVHPKLAQAVQHLTDCVLQQHLQSVLEHTTRVVQHVEGLLSSASGVNPTGASVLDAATRGPSSEAALATVSTPQVDMGLELQSHRGAAAGRRSARQQVLQAALPPSDSSVWLEVAEYLASQVHQQQHCSSSSNSGRESAGPGCALSRHGSNAGCSSANIMVASAADVDGLSLTAAATAVAATRGNSSGSRTGLLSHDGLHGWLAALQRAGNNASSAVSSSTTAGGPTLQDAVAWLQRQYLLLPASCKMDVDGACQWCRSM